MRIALASDHGGFELKKAVKAHLLSGGYEVEDLGTDSTDSCNYPIYGARAAHAVADGDCGLGIVICTTGIGISMAANKVRGIRCALCSDCYSAEMSRRHNNANMLALGAKIIGEGLACKIVDAFLSASFEGGRHKTRVDLITDIEEGRL